MFRRIRNILFALAAIAALGTTTACTETTGPAAATQGQGSGT